MTISSLGPLLVRSTAPGFEQLERSVAIARVRANAVASGRFTGASLNGDRPCFQECG